jgi:hypothetical protein
VSGFNDSGAIVGYYSDAFGCIHGFIDEFGFINTVGVADCPQAILLRNR